MLKPEFLNVEMVFTSDQLEKLFSEYVSEKVGFPVEIQLQYDGEHFRLWASMDKSRYSAEQLKKIADLGDVGPDAPLWTAQASGDSKGQTIYVATVTHNHGVNAFAAWTKEEILEELAAYARVWWNYEFQEPIPKDLSDEELVEHYFNRHPTEEYQIQVASFNA